MKVWSVRTKDEDFPSAGDTRPHPPHLISSHLNLNPVSSSSSSCPCPCPCCCCCRVRPIGSGRPVLEGGTLTGTSGDKMQAIGLETPGHGSPDRLCSGVIGSILPRTGISRRSVRAIADVDAKPAPCRQGQGTAVEVASDVLYGICERRSIRSNVPWRQVLETSRPGRVQDGWMDG